MASASSRPEHLAKCLALRLLIMLAWLAAIVWLSLDSSPPAAPGWLGWDKLQHALAYGVLAWLVAGVLVCWRSNENRHAWWQAWILTFCFGLSLEIMQHLMQRGRTAEWQDLAADSFGALVACVVFRHVQTLTSDHSLRKDE